MHIGICICMCMILESQESSYILKVTYTSWYNFPVCNTKSSRQNGFILVGGTWRQRGPQSHWEQCFNFDSSYLQTAAVPRPFFLPRVYAAWRQARQSVMKSRKMCPGFWLSMSHMLMIHTANTLQHTTSLQGWCARVIQLLISSKRR